MKTGRYDPVSWSSQPVKVAMSIPPTAPPQPPIPTTEDRARGRHPSIDRGADRIASVAHDLKRLKRAPRSERARRPIEDSLGPGVVP